ncbi:pseudouridine synthase [Leptolyngbya iicbica]|uniref:Pseudouridine synthase n=2 Tax=Cyanophyceae TaxID=3028117 RepID=A0A4Q7EB01_9CYAN|nr:pseudouridine synthase [Leptolyngbya sp. LK]RZM79664.1 rRNA pseudouridine synthase [Leptolyngbya sp. LK]
MEERLQKILSQWGVASRRGAESLIQAGRVSVNGAIAELGQKADPQRDRIQLDGRELTNRDRPPAYYGLLNKPLRTMSTCHDPQGRRTVIDFLPPSLQHDSGIHPVGRLDYNSTGAILLTNDGDLTYQLTHPRHHIAKTYRVIVRGQPSPDIIKRWQQGVRLDDYQTTPADVRILSSSKSSGQTELEVVLWEGRNRQIRRTAELLGHPVKQLHRLSIGPLQVGNLKFGQIRLLASHELKQLQGIVMNTADVRNVTE